MKRPTSTGEHDRTARIPVKEEHCGAEPELRLTCNDNGIVEDLPTVDHPLRSVIHNMLSNPEISVLGKGDLKHVYWAVVFDPTRDTSLHSTFQ